MIVVAGVGEIVVDGHHCSVPYKVVVMRRVGSTGGIVTVGEDTLQVTWQVLQLLVPVADRVGV